MAKAPPHTGTGAQSERLPIAVGDVLAAKYRVERVLGEGGMGVVVAARHIDLNELRAVKFLLPEARTETETIERFMREARAVVKLKSEHIVQVFDVGRFDSGEPYIVMEHLEGMDLKDHLDARTSLSVEESIDITMQTLQAMAEAHAANIVHRDLKPANIFLTTSATGDVCVKVLDFGISKLLEGEDDAMDMTTTHALMGSPYYMSPEQMMSTRDVDCRADVWSIGIVLYEMLTGRVPFRGKNIAAQCALLLQRNPTPPSKYFEGGSFPDGLDAAVLGFLAREPEDRFADVALASSALARFAPGAASRAKHVDRILNRRASMASLTGASDSGAKPYDGKDASKAASHPNIAEDDTEHDDRQPMTGVDEPTVSDGETAEASVAEAMSQSTKASWQTIDVEKPHARRRPWGRWAAGLLALGGIATLLLLREPPAEDAPGHAATSTALAATPSAPTPSATITSAPSLPPSSAPRSSAPRSSASANVPPSRVATPVWKPPPSRPRPVAPTQPSSAADPFGNSRR